MATIITIQETFEGEDGEPIVENVHQIWVGAAGRRAVHLDFTYEGNEGIYALKVLGAGLLTLCDAQGYNRELSIGKTNIEIGVMMAVKGVMLDLQDAEDVAIALAEDSPE